MYTGSTWRMFGSEYIDYINMDEKISGKDLLIIAPERKIDTKGKVKDGHILKIEIKDPVVLQPVNDGYLILSSWGLEASDELISNPINN